MLFFRFLLAVLCSAVLFSLGISNEFFNFGFPLFGFSGLTLLYYTLMRCKTYGRAGVLYGFFVSIVHIFSSFWLAFFKDFAIFTLGASTVAYFFLAFPFGILFHYIFKKNKTVRIFAFALIWVMWEFFKSNGFLAYPWGTVSMFCFNLKKFIQFVDITGVWGLSFIVPLICACVAEIANSYFTSSDFRFFLCNLKSLGNSLIFSFCLVVLITIYGTVILNSKNEADTFLNALVVQQNIDPWNTDSFDSYLKTTQELTYAAISESKIKPDIIVWSETSLLYPYEENKAFYGIMPIGDSFLSFLKKIDTPLFTGSPYVNEKMQNFNSACLILPDGSLVDFYSKMQLVAFAEYIPFADNPYVEKILNKIVGFSSGWTPGNKYTIFSINNSHGEKIKFTAPICFEDAFPSICTNLHNLGSQLFINMSNDSWSKTASAEYQHFIVSAFRALELRTTLVRSTNSGFSVVVDPFGSVVDTLPLFQPAAKVMEVPIYKHTKTVFAVFKNWFPFLLYCILLKILLSDWIDFIKKQAGQNVPSLRCTLSSKREFKKQIKRNKPIFAVKRKYSKKS